MPLYIIYYKYHHHSNGTREKKIYEKKDEQMIESVCRYRSACECLLLTLTSVFVCTRVSSIACIRIHFTHQ